MGRQCEWFPLGDGVVLATRFHARGMPTSERCDYRHATLHRAKAACLAARAWCGGVTKDDGLECAGAKPQYELRLRARVEDTRRVNSWIYSCDGSRPPPLPMYVAPPLEVPLWDPPAAEPCTSRCPTLRDVFVAVMTSAKYHSSRCALIKQTYAALLPSGHYAFYSDTYDATLPTVRVEEVDFPGARDASGNPYLRAQRRWPRALTHALTASRRARASWTLVVDDDTYVLPRNVLRVLRAYDPSTRVLIGQRCSRTRMCGGAGWVISLPLLEALVAVLPRCRARSDSWVDAHSDAFIGHCLHAHLNVTVTDRREFNSAEPEFYEGLKGREDKPRGYGAPATFHYVKTYDDWMTLHHLTAWTQARPL